MCYVKQQQLSSDDERRGDTLFFLLLDDEERYWFRVSRAVFFFLFQKERTDFFVFKNERQRNLPFTGSLPECLGQSQELIIQAPNWAAGTEALASTPVTHQGAHQQSRD